MEASKYIYTTGQPKVHFINYEFHKKPKKSHPKGILTSYEYEISEPEEIRGEDEGFQFSIALKAKITNISFSLKINLFADMGITGDGLTKELIQKDEDIHGFLLTPLASKFTEVLARLTSDSGAFPLIVPVIPEDIVKEQKERLEESLSES